MDIFTLIGLASLLLQIVVMVLVVYGYILKRKMRFRSHGIVMATATLLHLVLIAVIMIPSFALAVVPYYIIPEPLMMVSLVGLIHGVAGILTIVLGLWLVGAWRLKKDISGCIKRKKAMPPTFILWFISLVLGIVLFAIFYGPALMG